MKPVKTEPLVDQEVVGILEEWLEHAKAGRLRGVILAGPIEDGMGYAWRGFWRLSEALGTLEFAKHALLTQNYNESRGIEEE